MVLFISDLHLCAERPAVIQLFLDFLAREAICARALYILGDLFEAWIGDDDPDPDNARILSALRALTDSGVAVYVMHGNRDFLIGAEFEARTGCRLLPDPSVIDLFGQATLLMHGDSLCTDDIDHQTMRAQVRTPEWRQNILALPISQRVQLAQQYRAASRASMKTKSMDIMDVNQAAVEQAMREHGVTRMIHGHTHRPDVHSFWADGARYERIVLGDWYEQGSMLICDEHGCRSHGLLLSA